MILCEKIVKKIKKVIFFILIVCSILSCKTTYKMPMPIDLKENFTLKYTPDKKGLASLIELTGYYTQIRITQHKISKGFLGLKEEYVVDTFYMNYLFFEDGILLANVSPLGESNDTINLPIYLTKMAKDTTNSFKLFGIWGTYETSGDIIRTQTIRPSGSLNDTWSGMENLFKIIDRTSIKLIYRRPLYYLSPSDREIYTEQYYRDRLKNEEPAIFIKSDAIPSSDCWMKKESWFWKNEKDYIEYMNKKMANK